MSDLVLVAQIGRSYALSGEMFLHNLSDFEEQFKKGAKFYTQDKKEFEIASYDAHRGIVKFVGINDVLDAKKLTNLKLYTTKERTREQFELAEGEYFYFDIVGLDVIENGRLLGKVVEIREIGPSILLEVQTDKQLLTELTNSQAELNSAQHLANSSHKVAKLRVAKSFYIPYVDAYIERVDGAIYVRNALEILKQS